METVGYCWGIALLFHSVSPRGWWGIRARITDCLLMRVGFSSGVRKLLRYLSWGVAGYGVWYRSGWEVLRKNICCEGYWKFAGWLGSLSAQQRKLRHRMVDIELEVMEKERGTRKRKGKGGRWWQTLESRGKKRNGWTPFEVTEILHRRTRIPNSIQTLPCRRFWCHLLTKYSKLSALTS